MTPFRLPDETHLGRVKLQIADLDRSIAYYNRVIGLRTMQRAGESAVLGGHGDDTPIIELVEHRKARPVPRRGLLGLYHFAILLPDRASLGRFVRHLSELDIAAGMSDHLVSEAIYLQDPDNLGIEVYADRPRSTWRYDQGQLSMGTTPLDVDDLMAASGDEQWSGAPPGTRIGHVHLHVGDIERAATFYHDGLGLDKTVWNYPGALFLSAGGYHHHLGTNTWARGAQSASEEDARLLDWEVVVPEQADVDAAAANLERNGYHVERDGMVAAARDPWGTQVTVRR
ncbi:MAG: VOC family protein [Gemmatimonadaceae bacterium]